MEVRPLDPPVHGDALFRAMAGPENRDLWTYLKAGPFEDRASFESYLKTQSALEDPLCFAIVDRRSDAALGLASYMRIEPAHGVIEVGSIVFSRPLHRSTGATEAMYLMARHAFEELGHRRYEWKCNALNLASRNAALRLGFRFEGIFRNHMVVKGRSRDTAWFSIVDSEWPARREAFERWLDPSNFDESGRQRISLSSLNRP